MASAWQTFKQALSGSERVDHTSGVLGRSLVLLAVPMVMEMAMESLFAVSDVFWVSRLGSDAIAVVGITESLMTVVYALAMGLAMAAAALVSRRIGEKDPDGAARAAAHAMALGLGVALVLGVLGATMGDRMLGVMGASQKVVAQGGTFVRIMLGGNLVIFMLFLINAVFRGAGDAAIAMRTLWLANILNIVLGPCFIFGVGPLPEMGVTGAAVATTIGRSVGVIYQLVALSRAQSRIRIQRQHLRFDGGLFASLARIGGNGAAQALISTASWVALTRILTGFGSKAVAGYTIGIRIVLFAILPAWGLSNAAATLVGQNLGAQQPDRAESAVRLAARIGFMFLGGVGIVFVVLAGPIVGLFTDDAETLRHGTRALRFIALGFPLYAWAMIYTAAFNGAGDTWTPTLINLLCFWLCEIPLAWALSHGLGWGTDGVFVAVTFAFSLMAVVAYAWFRRGGWKWKAV